MFVEKIGNPVIGIRCTLFSDDLICRNLELNDFRKSGKNAIGLINEILRIASTSFKFKLKNMPLHVVTFPINKHKSICYLAYITKDTPLEELQWFHLNSVSKGVEILLTAVSVDCKISTFELLFKELTIDKLRDGKAPEVKLFYEEIFKFANLDKLSAYTFLNFNAERIENNMVAINIKAYERIHI